MLASIRIMAIQILKIIDLFSLKVSVKEKNLFLF